MLITKFVLLNSRSLFSIDQVKQPAMNKIVLNNILVICLFKVCHGLFFKATDTERKCFNVDIPRRTDVIGE